jgi:hypothetical protein
MQDRILVLEMGAAHCEVLAELGDEALDLGIAGRVRRTDGDEAAHVGGANALVDRAVEIVSSLVDHQMLLASMVRTPVRCAGNRRLASVHHFGILALTLLDLGIISWIAFEP